MLTYYSVQYTFPSACTTLALHGLAFSLVYPTAIRSAQVRIVWSSWRRQKSQIMFLNDLTHPNMWIVKKFIVDTLIGIKQSIWNISGRKTNIGLLRPHSTFHIPIPRPGFPQRDADWWPPLWCRATGLAPASGPPCRHSTSTRITWTPLVTVIIQVVNQPKTCITRTEVTRDF